MRSAKNPIVKQVPRSMLDKLLGSVWTVCGTVQRITPFGLVAIHYIRYNSLNWNTCNPAWITKVYVYRQLDQYKHRLAEPYWEHIGEHEVARYLMDRYAVHDGQDSSYSIPPVLHFELLDERVTQ